MVSINEDNTVIGLYTEITLGRDVCSAGRETFFIHRIGLDRVGLELIIKQREFTLEEIRKLNKFDMPGVDQFDNHGASYISKYL